MQVSALSAAASGGANEDWVSVSSDLIVVLDGATVRTATGCSHDVAWYVAKLGSALKGRASDRQESLPAALSAAIEQTAGQHPKCDLQHRGTPSAALAVARTKGEEIDYLVLGDVTVIIDTVDGTRIVCDNRVDATARRERDEADGHPIGSAEKQAAMLLMKNAELAARNQTGGYWVAAADPDVSTYALTGAVRTANIRRMAVLTDGAARLVTPFNVVSWSGLLDILEEGGPGEVIRRVRSIEDSDSRGLRWPRNKRSDDATVVYARPI